MRCAISFPYSLRLDMLCALLLMFPTKTTMTTTVGISVDSTPNAVQLAHGMILVPNEKEEEANSMADYHAKCVCAHIVVDRVCCIPLENKVYLI